MVIDMSKVVVVAGIEKLCIQQHALSSTAATQSQTQDDRRFGSNIVIPKRSTVFELLSALYQSLLIIRDGLFHHNLLLEAISCVAYSNVIFGHFPR